MHYIVRFGPYEADLSAGQLHKHGTRIRLRQQSFEVLASLVEHAGELVTREALQRRLWCDDVCVDFDNNLNTAVAQLRQVLNDSADRPRYIETLPKRGYRFIGDVFALSPEATEASPARVRIVLLPLLNQFGDPSQEYFSDAMTDEIITALVRIAPEHLGVIARTTAMHYKGSHKDVARISRELKADYVVEGAISRSDERIGINVQLIRAVDQTHLFARKYDAEMCNLFSIHDSIAQDIIEHIPALLSSVRDSAVPKVPRRKPTENLAAYHEYLKGRSEMLNVTPQGIAAAKQYFEAALARDPDFALAYCGFAQLYWYIGFWGFAPSRNTDPVGRFYALRAIETDPTLAESYALLSYYPKQRHFDEPLCYYEWQASLKDVVRAEELNPRSQLAQMRHAIILMVLGRNQEAAAKLEKILDSDPLSMEVRVWFVEVLCLARQSDRALQEALRIVELEPQHFLSHFALAQAYLALQRYDKSVAAARRAADLTGGLPLMLGWLGLSLGLGGYTEEACALLASLHSAAGDRFIPPTCFAWLNLGLGNVNEAFLWMDRAVDAPDRMMSPIKSYPFLDPYRADPRFSVLLKKMKLQ